MFKIIGGDQKEYGPVTLEQLTQWVRDNRANAQTLVQKEGGPWVPLGSLPEFAAILAERQGSGPIPSSVTEPLPSGGSDPTIIPSMPTGPAPGIPIGIPGDRELARAQIQGPAIGLLVTGILLVIFALIGLVGNLMGATFRPPPGEVPPEFQQLMNVLEGMQGPMAIVSSLIGLAISGLVIFAAQKMRMLESFALVVTATILAMVPCTSPCCCIGIPVGIWVLVVLFKPEVKAAFN